jgi:hypothetical protein
MTSIAATGLQQYSSPRDLLQSELSSEISAGTIGATDGSALSSALDDIDAALQSDRASTSSTGSQPPSPDDMKKKIDGLIASEVQNGKLTDDQATELQNVFAKTFQNGGPGGGPRGPGGPGGAGGPGGSASNSASSDTSNSSSDSTTKLLQDFLKLLQDSQGTTGYNASGDAQGQSTSLLVNYQT